MTRSSLSFVRYELPQRGEQPHIWGPRPTQDGVQGALMSLRDLVTSSFATNAKEEPVMVMTAKVVLFEGNQLEAGRAEQENPPNRDTSSR